MTNSNSQLIPFTAKDVAEQSTMDRPLFIYQQKVYDLTDFVDAHPGGEVLLDFHGQEITEILADERHHAHSDAAYEMMEDYCIGYLSPSTTTTTATTATTTTTATMASSVVIDSSLVQCPSYSSLDSFNTKVSEDSASSSGADSLTSISSISQEKQKHRRLSTTGDSPLIEPITVATTLFDTTNVTTSDELKDNTKDFTALPDSAMFSQRTGGRDNFLDLNKPLFAQLWNLKLDRATYLREVHSPRYLKEPARFFDNPIMEFLSRNPWWVVPIVWLPVSYWMYTKARDAHGVSYGVSMFVGGIGFWTFLEYTLHRFLFHMDEKIPNHRYGFLLHFLFHGVHHYLPMDRLRLVFPPALALVILYPIWGTVAILAQSTAFAYGLLSGGLFGYVGYDLTHYYLHHGRPYFEYLRVMKSYQYVFCWVSSDLKRPLPVPVLVPVPLALPPRLPIASIITTRIIRKAMGSRPSSGTRSGAPSWYEARTLSTICVGGYPWPML